jgi:hypothetical protein
MGAAERGLRESQSTPTGPDASAPIVESVKLDSIQAADNVETLNLKLEEFAAGARHACPSERISFGEEVSQLLFLGLHVFQGMSAGHYFAGDPFCHLDAGTFQG